MNLYAQGVNVGRVLFRTLLRPVYKWTWNNSSVDQITSGAIKLTCEPNSRTEASQTTPNHHNFFLSANFHNFSPTNTVYTWWLPGSSPLWRRRGQGTPSTNSLKALRKLPLMTLRTSPTPRMR